MNLDSRSNLRISSRLTAVALGALLSGPATSQTPAGATPNPAQRAATAWCAPIHTQADDPAFGAYGWWAAHRDYKVSFHDGFVFYPFLGPDYPENLPLRWTTVRVTAGGEPIADLGAARSEHTDWRWEYHFDGVIEAYDVRDDGVEQTFVVRERPRRAGDIVVEGRVQTKLRPTQPMAPAAQQALVFADARGTPLVHYGKAFAFDARGSRTDVTTSLEGEVVRLTVPGAWLADAVFPVTVDPLTSRAVISMGSTSAAYGSPSIHREDESGTDQIMVARSRQFSAGDFDVEVLLGRDSGSSMQYVYGDVSTAYNSLLPDVTFVGGADRWVVGFWRNSAGENRVRAYFHDKGNLFYNSGVLATNHNPANEHASFPAVGGTSHPTVGTMGLMVYRADPFYGNSPTSVIWGVGIDAAARAFTPQRVRVSRTDLDAESPDVNCQIGWGESGWVVVYQARSDALDDHDIHAARISTSLGWAGDAQIGPDGLGDKARPVVAGWDGRYMVAMLQDVTPETFGQYFGRNVRVTRFDWPDSSGMPTVRDDRVAVSRPNQELTQLDLAFDGATRSHWCLVAEQAGPRILVRRLGYRGGVTESADIESGANGRYHPAVAWNSARREFPIVYCTTEVGASFCRQDFTYPTTAWNLVYGNGCGPGTIGSDTPPYAGSEFYRVSLGSAPPAQPAVLMVSTQATGVELGALGAPNCFLNLSPILVTVPMVTDATGSCTFTTALRDVPLANGDLYWQFAYGWPARPHDLAIGATRGLRAHVQ